jgi:hypothetical protein
MQKTSRSSTGLDKSQTPNASINTRSPQHKSPNWKAATTIRGIQVLTNDAGSVFETVKGTERPLREDDFLSHRDGFLNQEMVGEWAERKEEEKGERWRRMAEGAGDDEAEVGHRCGEGSREMGVEEQKREMEVERVEMNRKFPYGIGLVHLRVRTRASREEDKGGEVDEDGFDIDKEYPIWDGK